MDVFIEIAKLTMVGLIAGLFSSFVANRDFRYKKWWELRVSAYQALIESLSDLVHYYDKHYSAEIENREINEEYEKKLGLFWEEAYPKVRKAADTGAFLFSPEVNQALESLIKNGRVRYTTYFEDLDNSLAEAKKCLAIVVASSKRDLKIKSPWL